MIEIEHKELPFYHIELKNIFFESELSEIKQEIVSLKKDFKSPEDTGSAFTEKELLKKNKGIFLNNLSKNSDFFVEKINNTLKVVVKKSNWKNSCFKRIFDNLEWYGDLIQHYENLDYYKPHYDYGIFTLVIWIYDGGKNISGGDLYFPEYDYLHNCKDNSGLIFFSKELHGVTTLKSNDNFNRYSITTFSSYIPEKIDDSMKSKRLLLNSKSDFNINYN
jgi:hypothetical protein